MARAAHKKESSLLAAIGDQWDEEPGDIERMLAARGLGVDGDQIPCFPTNYELQIWVFRMHALQGSESHFKELGDRMAPKPSRNQAKAPMRGPSVGAMTAAGAAETREADVWFAGLSGGGPPSDEDML